MLTQIEEKTNQNQEKQWKHPKLLHTSQTLDFGRCSALRTTILLHVSRAFQPILAYVFSAFDKPLTENILYQNANSMT